MATAATHDDQEHNHDQDGIPKPSTCRLLAASRPRSGGIRITAANVRSLVTSAPRRVRDRNALAI